jgi:hypothetical protein
MPLNNRIILPILSDSADFERLVRDLCAKEWSDDNTEMFGRSGQKQFGVDIYGQPFGIDGKCRGAQCKLRTKQGASDRLSRKEIEYEVKEARNFPHPLDILIIVTSYSRDTNTQILIDEISKREIDAGYFAVKIWFWEDVQERLSSYTELCIKYYPNFFISLSNLPEVHQLIGIPIQIKILGIDNETESFANLLRLRGLRIIYNNTITNPDGILCFASEQNLQQLTAEIYALQKQKKHPPVIVVGNDIYLENFAGKLDELGGKSSEIKSISSRQDENEIADTIFEMVFAVGYGNRGCPANLDISARMNTHKPEQVLLDLDWQDNYLPTVEEWIEYYLPALNSLKRNLGNLGGNTSLLINSQLRLPAAIALGFHFPLFNSDVRVWARKVGGSYFKEQCWSSSADEGSEKPAVDYVVDDNNTNSPYSAIIEITTGTDIESQIRNFITEQNLQFDTWRRIRRPASIGNITEELAVSFANFVGQELRDMATNGITDFHIFAKIPSALAILIGQRLHSCGNMHFYWYDNNSNPKYRYAFTLN